MKRKRAAVAVALAGGILAGCSESGRDVVAADAAPPPEPAVVRSAQPTPKARPAVELPPPLSAQTLRRITRGAVFDLEVVDEADEHPGLSAARMLATATRNHRGERPAEMSLVRLHWHQKRIDAHGMTPKEAAASQRQLDRMQNVLVWGLLFRDDTFPIMGPPRDRTGEPCCYTADNAVFLDADTGEHFYSGSL